MIDVAAGKYYYYHFDGLGSVVALSDENGDIVERYEYSVYDQTQILSASHEPRATSDYSNPYMFTGRRYDDETGLYYYRARMYYPELGRFMQPDPLGYWNSMNLYLYCFNNPLIYVDPHGEWITSAVGGAVGGIIGGITGGWRGGWKGAVSGAVGGAITGGLIGSGMHPIAAGAIGGTASSGLGQLLHGENPASTAGLGKLAVGAGTGALGGWVGGSFGEGAAAGIIEGLGVGMAGEAGNQAINFADKAAQALRGFAEEEARRLEKACKDTD